MKLTELQADALAEMINIGTGRAASVLNSMLRAHVRLEVPVVELLVLSDLKEKMRLLGEDVLSAVQLAFKGPFSGEASLIFPTESAARLVTLLTEDETELFDLDAIRIGTLTEVGNIVLNGVMGVLGNEVKEHICYSVPTYTENPAKTLLSDAPSSNAPVIWVRTRFQVEQNQIDGDIILVFELGSLDLLLAALDRQLASQP